MRIHHLNCGTMCPRGARLINGEGGLLAPGRIVCHCLLIEAGDALVLVDTGFGSEDARNRRRLGVVFNALMAPRPRPETTAAEQIRRLGHDPDDVRHIVTTHLDLDHAGGLGDFPRAEVHLLAAERQAALHPGLRDRSRYLAAHWRHDPRWVEHAEGGGDEWYGFESVRILPGLDADVLLVPLLGHSLGHTGVAVDTGDGWLLHCGDAYFHHDEVATPPGCPPLLRLFQGLVASDNSARLRNRDRLRELAARHGDEVDLVSSHDPEELRLHQAAGPASTASR